MTFNCRFDDPILNYANDSVTVLSHKLSVQEALDEIRNNGISGDRIIYFYVKNDTEQLCGVLPTRKLLTSAPEQKLSDIMIENVIAIPSSASVIEACELFTLYKFLAYPVVDEKQRVKGVVDISLFTEEILNIGERERIDEIFETVGFRVSQLRHKSVFEIFRIRFPWLTATIASGIICALLASIYETTLSENILLAFFLTMVLGLGESMAVQTLTLTIYSLKHEKLSKDWFMRELKKQSGLSFLIGLSCAAVVAIIIFLWKGSAMPAVSIAVSILLSLITSCLIGVMIPSLMHSLKLDPKIASGPIALAVADVFTILIYFNMARILL
ncbi:MAG: magnesium transporter MgtE [Lentisphaerae bacterium GWF2_44_16]|nr:MAG: magnesium transporter MgtE [Lentisphaerae bacterium GWF2_44_16]